MVYFWPADAVKIGWSVCWQLREGDVTCLWHEPIWDLAEWEVLPARMVSPSHLYVLNEHKPLGALPRMPVLELGPSQSLLQHAAREAFGSLSKQQLLKLDKEELAAVAGETEIGDIVFVMVQRALECSDTEVVGILQKRCLKVDLADRLEILQSEAAEEVADKDAQKELDRMAVADRMSDVGGC
eukprot:45665-Amphidinium_carterae.3